MLISYKKRFVFVHIKKTAGSSVTRSLKRYDDRNLFLKLLNLKTLTKVAYFRNKNPLPFHAKAHEIRDYLGPSYEDYFSFAFVRNPFDWQVSNYFYIKQSKLHPRHQEVKDLSFNEYLEWTLKENRLYPQSLSISEKSDHSNVIVDFVGKFENLDADFHFALSRIGIASGAFLGKTNQSKRQLGYRQYYNDDSIQFIRRYYKEDLDNFDYDF